jgi:hypothetical protein
MVLPLGGAHRSIVLRGTRMRHRVIAAAAAASVLLIGTALPSVATGDESGPSHSDSTEWNHDGHDEGKDGDKGKHDDREDDDRDGKKDEGKDDDRDGKKDDDRDGKKDDDRDGKKDDDHDKVVKVVKVIKMVDKDVKVVHKDVSKDVKKDVKVIHKDDDKEDKDDHKKVEVPTKVNAGFDGASKTSDDAPWLFGLAAGVALATAGAGTVVALRRNTNGV